MRTITEVIYNNEGNVASVYFESTDRYTEWRENNPECEILEILHDFVDDSGEYITPSEINTIIASLPKEVQQSKISYDSKLNICIANGKIIEYPVKVTALSYCTGELVISTLPDMQTVLDLMVDEWCLFQTNE